MPLKVAQVNQVRASLHAKSSVNDNAKVHLLARFLMIKQASTNQQLKELEGEEEAVCQKWGQRKEGLW